MINATDITTLVATSTSYATTLLTGTLGSILIWVIGIAILFMALGWVLGVFKRRKH
jgi:hypothetical protein